MIALLIATLFASAGLFAVAVIVDTCIGARRPDRYAPPPAGDDADVDRVHAGTASDAPWIVDGWSFDGELAAND